MSSDDKAWVEIPCPQAPAALADFCRDIERLLRINPLLEFEEWIALGPNRYRMRGRNLSNDRPFATELVAQQDAPGRLTLHYSEGLKSATLVEWEARGTQGLLRITDDYSGTPEAERASRLNEVDRSLTAWGEGLQRYCVVLDRWGWCPLWHWYMRRLWLPMKPLARRASALLIQIHIAFFVLFLFVTLIYWVEQNAH